MIIVYHRRPYVFEENSFTEIFSYSRFCVNLPSDENRSITWGGFTMSKKHAVQKLRLTEQRFGTLTSYYFSSATNQQYNRPTTVPHQSRPTLRGSMCLLYFLSSCPPKQSVSNWTPYSHNHTHHSNMAFS